MNEGIDSENPECDITSRRWFDVTAEALFAAFADPEALAQWWGPKGFRNSFEAFDFRPGGRWIFDMHAPDGSRYHNESVFVEIARPKRIVLEHLKDVHWFRLTVTFIERDGRTRLIWNMRFESAEECERVRQPVIAANEENFDRLESYLARSM